MNHILFARRAVAAFGSILLLAGCFGAVTVVPAAQAPKLPPGEGWSCFEAITAKRYATPPQSKHTVHCKRDPDSCTRSADAQRKTPGVEAVTTCAPREAAFCTATFVSEDDPYWSCFGAAEDCQNIVGGVAGAPGTKMSECAQYM